MKCTELKQDDIVLFKRFDSITKREQYQDGSVISVHEDTNKVTVCWLEGYKSRVDKISFDKIISRYNENGEYMTFDNYHGNSDLIEHQ